MPETPRMANDAGAGLDRLMEKAAQLRAVGKTWAEVAEAVGRSETTVCHWPLNHAAKWNALLVKAIDDTLGTYEQEALLVAREALRSKEDRIAGARMLLEHARKLRGERLKIGGDGGGPLNILITEAKKPEEGDT